MVAAAPENSEEKENLKKKFELSGEECQLAQERMEHMKQWESQKPVNVASGIVRVRTVSIVKKVKILLLMDHAENAERSPI